MIHQPAVPAAMINLQDIDRTPAAAVRIRCDDATLARYAEAYVRNEQLPPVEVYTWPNAGVYLLADGQHRCAARERAGKGTINAEVHVCDTEAEARSRALTHAASANDRHGLPRTVADRRAAVAAVLRNPDFAASADREIATICRVGHTLVRLVREELTHKGILSGRASAHYRLYKPAARLRGNSITDGTGGLNPAPPSSRPNPARGHRRRNILSPASIPCPLLSPAGTHAQSGHCRVCHDRGWLTQEEYRELSPELKHISQAAKPHVIDIAAASATIREVIDRYRPAPDLRHRLDRVMAVLGGWANS